MASLQCIRLVENYYKGIFSESFSEAATSAWHRHQREIFVGCTSFISLFLASMNIILEYSLQIKVPKFTTNNNELLLLCAVMDDLSLMSSAVSGAQTLLSRCTTALTWAGLGLRADKSHSIVIIKCTSMSTARVSVSKAADQPQHSRQVKFLGRIIDGSFSDRNSSVELAHKLLAGLRAIDKSHFTGTQKLWILQHLLIPRIQWPLLIDEVPISLAFKLEQIGSVFIRKWLHLHYSTSSLCFYSSASPCPLPIKSLSSALKAARISGHLLLINFQNLLVSSCVPKLQTGLGRLKIERQVAIGSSESDIKFSKICESQHNNRLGLGYATTSKIPKKKSSKDYRKYISNHHTTSGDTYAMSKNIKLQIQCQWTR